MECERRMWFPAAPLRGCWRSRGAAMRESWVATPLTWSNCGGLDRGQRGLTSTCKQTTPITRGAHAVDQWGRGPGARQRHGGTLRSGCRIAITVRVPAWHKGQRIGGAGTSSVVVGLASDPSGVAFAHAACSRSRA